MTKETVLDNLKAAITHLEEKRQQEKIEFVHGKKGVSPTTF